MADLKAAEIIPARRSRIGMNEPEPKHKPFGRGLGGMTGMANMRQVIGEESNGHRVSLLMYALALRTLILETSIIMFHQLALTLTNAGFSVPALFVVYEI